MEYISLSEEMTMEIASEFARDLGPGTVIALEGNLGAGKTVFTKGLVLGLGCSQKVTSPTFTIINNYRGRLPINHVDCYRLESVADIDDLDPTELFYPEGVTIIEWAEKVREYLPEKYWLVRFEILGQTHRRVAFFENHWPD